MPTSTRAKIKEYLILLWVNFVTQIKNLAEFLKVIIRYYGKWSYAKVDGSLLLTYLFDNPFTISKRFLMKRGAKDVYAYGETPLTTLDIIARQSQLTSSDTVFELGCGRGRTCFWLRQFIGCKVVGIEYIPQFTEHANRVAKKLRVDRIEFRNVDLLETSFEGATAFYLYGTCYEDEFIEKLIKKFKKCPPGTKIITISYPLTDYISEPVFEVMKRFPAEFTWGSADVYVQIVKNSGS